MSNPELKLVDPLPVATRPITSSELALAHGGHKQLRMIRVFRSRTELVDAAMDPGDLGDEARGAYEDALKACSVYKQWQRAMPYLRDVPEIHRYRTNHSKDLSAVDREVLANGGFLASGQVLFHGAVLTAAEILTTDPISTSMNPGVARWHAIRDGGDLGILRISESHSIRAFAYKATGNQELKREYEVLLQGGLKLALTSKRTVCGIQVKEYDVSIR